MLPDSAQPLLVKMFRDAGHDVPDDADFQFDFDVEVYSGCDTCGHGSSTDLEIWVYAGYSKWSGASMNFSDMPAFLAALFGS